jgi:hypothetical protein
MTYRIVFVDDPLSPTPTELHLAFATSLETAMDVAMIGLVNLRKDHGNAGYRIEDATGSTVRIGPGANENENA